MSEEEVRELSAKLLQALRESYRKMLLQKLKLGQDLVISDGKGNPVTITAEEAWRRYQENAAKRDAFDAQL